MLQRMVEPSPIRAAELVSAHITISDEVGGYAAALSRAHLDVVRTGEGCGPNTLATESFDDAQMFAGLIQFPVIGRTIINDGIIAAALIVRAPKGTRWCEIDVSPGDLLLYGPGAEHIGVSPVGVEYRFALIDLSAVGLVAEELQIRADHPARGSITRTSPSAAGRVLRSELLSIGKPSGRLGNPRTTSVRLMRATAQLLADTSPSPTRRRACHVSSRRIVNASIDYSDRIEGRPSIAELCTVAHVSQRRLREAFYDTFDMSPMSFLRTRQLSYARERLLTGEQRVTEVALDLGFDHLGRFAAQYADIYGEHPSTTLATARAGARPDAASSGT